MKKIDATVQISSEDFEYFRKLEANNERYKKIIDKAIDETMSIVHNWKGGIHEDTLNSVIKKSVFIRQHRGLSNKNFTLDQAIADFLTEKLREVRDQIITK